jgi:hypothetical protein
MHNQPSNDLSFTPAPWRVIPTAAFDGAKHVSIAEAGDLCVVADRRSFDKAQIPANLQLIAAAPDFVLFTVIMALPKVSCFKGEEQIYSAACGSHVLRKGASANDDRPIHAVHYAGV